MANRRQIDDQRQSLLEQERLISERNRELAAWIEELRNTNILAEKLKFELARYQRWRFGKKSEALGAEQIALWEAELDADIEALQKRLEDLQAGLQSKDKDKKPSEKRKPKREALPVLRIDHHGTGSTSTDRQGHCRHQRDRQPHERRAQADPRWATSG